jgi:hypothetical protein
MGHTRLGRIPKTKTWIAVVRDVGAPPEAHGQVEAFDIREVAGRTLVAAQGGLRAATKDEGLKYTFFILSQIALASRTKNWAKSLKDLGINVSAATSLEDLSAEMQACVDRQLRNQGCVTDVSEIAQKAAGEAMLSLTRERLSTLFGLSSEEVRLAVRNLSTKKGFGDLGQKFFGTFMTRFLNFYLSRVTAAYVGKSRISQVDDISSFNKALRVHCEQSARILRDFCAQWYSKTVHLGGINLDNLSGFIAVALKKLQAELRQQETER